MTQKDSAATQRRSVARELKAARENFLTGPEHKPMSLEEAAAKLFISSRTLRRLESGEHTPKHGTVKNVCELYEFSREAKERILEKVLLAGQEEWFEKYRQDIDPWLVQLLELELIADRIFMYGSIIPGPFQTADYAAAVAAQNPRYLKDHDYARRFSEMRSQRAKNLLGRNHLKLGSILDEAALRSTPASPAIMQEQMDHLLMVSRKRNIDILVLLFKSGARSGVKCGFTFLEFDDKDEPDVGYNETYMTGQYSVKPKVLDELRWTYDTLKGQSVPLKEYLQ